MRVVRSSLAVLSIAAMLAGNAAFAGPRDDDDRGKQVQKTARAVEKGPALPAFIKRILDYLDNKLTVPPT